jgi:hypothetical protein
MMEKGEDAALAQKHSNVALTLLKVGIASSLTNLKLPSPLFLGNSIYYCVRSTEYEYVLQVVRIRSISYPRLVHRKGGVGGSQVAYSTEGVKSKDRNRRKRKKNRRYGIEITS